MEERTATLENAYYRNVLYVIAEALGKIPRPAHVVEKPSSKSITQYFFKEPIRTEDLRKQQGRITVTYSVTKTTQFASMAGLIFEKEPIVFECVQEADGSVVVKGSCSASPESTIWIRPIFDQIWEELLKDFSK